MSETLSLETLRASYASYGAPRERWLVGGEYERAVVRGDGQAVAYHDDDGIRWILDRLRERTGWKEKREGEWPIEHTGEGASITLEPGGQVELSGAPFRSLTDLAAEVRRNREQLYALSAGHDHHWISCGLTPYARIADIPFVPKGRYRVMQAYLPQYGDLAHWMMKGTCSVQANYDYSDEADCARKFHVALDLAPLTVAMFANSPLAEGKLTGWQSYRGHIWTRTDPRRTGFPPGVRERYTHDGWVNYLLDTPMMFYKRGDEWAHAGGVTFREWMTAGIGGIFPSAADWELHQTSVFPEVRVKRTIEIRGADAVDVNLSIAFCAYWTGLFYSDAALSAARAVADVFARDASTHEERHVIAAKGGLDAVLCGRPAVELAREVVEISRRGLVEIGQDAALLEPLMAVVASGRSPARAVIEAFERDPSPGNVLPVVAY